MKNIKSRCSFVTFCQTILTAHEILVLFPVMSILSRAFAAHIVKEWMFSKTCLEPPLKNRKKQRS